MIIDGKVVGLPLVEYTDTKSAIQAITSGSAGMIAYSTDTQELGALGSGGWVWMSTSGSASAQYKYLVSGATPFVYAESLGALNIASGNTLTVRDITSTSFYYDDEAGRYVINFNGTTTLGFLPLAKGDFLTNFSLEEEAGYEKIVLQPLAGGYQSILKLENSGAAALTYTLAGGGALYLGGYTLTAPTSGSVALGAGTLTVSSTSNVTVASHTHAVTSSSSPGAAASLLASSASGYLQLVRLGVGVSPTVPLEVYGKIIGGIPVASTSAAAMKFTNNVNEQTFYLYGESHPDNALAFVGTDSYGMYFGTSSSTTTHYIFRCAYGGNAKIGSGQTDAFAVYAGGRAYFLGNVGINEGSPAAKLTVKVTTDIQAFLVLGNTVQAAALPLAQVTRTDTNAGISAVLGLTAAGGGANGDGGSILLRGKSSTATSTDMGAIKWLWVNATHASRTAKLQLTAYDTAERVGLEIAADGSLPTLNLLGATVGNEAGDTTTDLRWETDTESNALLVDASADKVYIGGTTNGLEISKGGTLKALGTATWFDDLRVEPTVRSSGAKAPSYVNYTAGGSASGLYFYLFDNAAVSSEKEVNFKIQMPHGKLLASAIHLHVHWVPTTTGNADEKVRWGLEYTKANPNGTFGAVGAYIYATDPVSPPSTTPTAHTHYITEFADIDMTGDSLSTILLCRLFRNSSDAADSFAGDVGLLYIDCHVEYSQLGSNDEYTQ